MNLRPPRLSVVLLGDRLVAAVQAAQGFDVFVIEAEQPAAALRAELDQRGLAPRTVALGLSRAAVSVKPIELPAVDGEAREMVRFELERHLPFAGEDAAFDVIPLPADQPRPAEAASHPVLVAAADRRVVDGALRIAEDAKLKPLSVTVAVHDLTALVPRRRQGHIVWVHRLGEVAEILFLAGPHLVLSRTVAAVDDGQVVSEIRRSFAITRWRGADAVWLSGDAEAPGQPSASRLTELGAPVTAPPYTSRAARHIAALGEGPRGALLLALAVASGRGARPLDLLPPALRPRRLTRSQVTTVGTAAAVIVLGVAAILAPGYRDMQRLDIINHRLAKLEPQLRSVEQVARELERRQKLLTTIESLVTGSIRPLPVLRDLTDLLPTDAWLTMLTLDLKGVELTGQAAAASALIPLLENSPRLERAEFSSPVTRGRDREQFRIRAAWEGGIAAAFAPKAPPAPAPAAAAPGAPAAVPAAPAVKRPSPPVSPAVRPPAPPRTGGGS